MYIVKDIKFVKTCDVIELELRPSLDSSLNLGSKLNNVKARSSPNFKSSGELFYKLKKSQIDANPSLSAFLLKVKT